MFDSSRVKCREIFSITVSKMLEGPQISILSTILASGDTKFDEDTIMNSCGSINKEENSMSVSNWSEIFCHLVFALTRLYATVSGHHRNFPPSSLSSGGITYKLRSHPRFEEKWS